MDAKQHDRKKEKTKRIWTFFYPYLYITSFHVFCRVETLDSNIDLFTSDGNAL